MEHSSNNPLVVLSVLKPKMIMIMLVISTLVLGAFIPLITIDTDPENMLAKTEPVRIYHDAMKEEFSLSDMVVLGIVNEEHEYGVFNPQSLKNIYELTEYIKTLRWENEDIPGEYEGVVEVDLLAPSTVDNIKQRGLGVVEFEWLMQTPPKTQEEALAIKAHAQRIPFLDGTLISEDARALCIYIPLTSKDMSYKISALINKKTEDLKGNDHYYITGLPVAEDTFGVEMFKQMAISAPLAMLIIFLLLWIFFKKLQLIISPMIVALCSVITTMGLLIGTGNTVHIMSSMIPIFIMPIAVLDSIHILSEFFELYPRYKDRKGTVEAVMKELFVPMLYTSLTSAAGFASLALTPIPPVQTFGIFIAVGIMFAWLLTITVIPAYIMLMPERSLKNFGTTEHKNEKKSLLTQFLNSVCSITIRKAKTILALTVVVAIIAAYGISLIQINDNPTRWFKKDHPIRVADYVLNEHFGGTYMGYLVLESTEDISLKEMVSTLIGTIHERLAALENDGLSTGQVEQRAVEKIKTLAREENGKGDFIQEMQRFAEAEYENAADEELDAWDEVVYCIGVLEQQGQVFKRPEILAYIAKLQKILQQTDVVGKSNSIVDIVKTVHRELRLGKDEEFRIPETSDAVAQCLLTYQNSHRPNDLWHFVTMDYTKTNLWIQLRSGDNKDMAEVVAFVNAYIKKNPPPGELEHKWFGLTYINIRWQEKMVSGMLRAFLGSFLVVFLMMAYLFRSPLWGFLSMIPLSVTIAFIYGTVGLIGKDYDMPIAVLSSLTLGLAVDFAIHFLVRTRELYLQEGSWDKTAQRMFEEPARAITRNVIVIAVGFLPLLAAPLMPYKTVGVFLATILAVSGIGTLLILPALITVLGNKLFAQLEGNKKIMCNCGACGVMALSFVALVALNFHQYIPEHNGTRIALAIAVLVTTGGVCCLFKKRFCAQQ